MRRPGVSLERLEQVEQVGGPGVEFGIVGYTHVGGVDRPLIGYTHASGVDRPLVAWKGWEVVIPQMN